MVATGMADVTKVTPVIAGWDWMAIPSIQVMTAACARVQKGTPGDMSCLQLTMMLILGWSVRIEECVIVILEYVIVMSLSKGMLASAISVGMIAQTKAYAYLSGCSLKWVDTLMTSHGML